MSKQPQEDQPRPYDTPELTEQEVLQHSYPLLPEQLPLRADGYACTTEDLFKVWLGVAVTRGTLESVCADLVGTPDPQTSRRSLKAHLCVEELPEVERRLNAALAAELPPRGFASQTQPVPVGGSPRFLSGVASTAISAQFAEA